jgi:hypothetical protein
MPDRGQGTLHSVPACARRLLALTVWRRTHRSDVRAIVYPAGLLGLFWVSLAYLMPRAWRRTGIHVDQISVW